ncbi:MAG: succinylglutamate desuccinylase/aspartoacylase family protein [Bacteroidia bacterium]
MSIYINQQEIKSGENKTVILNSYELHTKTHIEIPVHVINAEKPGPTIFLGAGMHGEETNGVEIIRKIIRKPEVYNLKCGTIIAIPVINIISFLYGSRDLPDGRDLNRCFPGSKNGSIGRRIAYDLMKHIIPIIDFGIDFHTGGAKINNYPQIRCVFDIEKNHQLADRFGTHFTINAPHRDGTLRKESSKREKPILVYEGGESMRFDYLAIQEGINGCLRMMKSFEMIETNIEPVESIKIYSDKWVRANSSGLFHMNKKNGEKVMQGELLGMVCNPFGNIEDKLLCPQDGYIVGINNQPVVNQGDALIHLGFAE